MPNSKFSAIIYLPDDSKRNEWRWVLWMEWEVAATGVTASRHACVIALAFATSEWDLDRLEVTVLDGEREINETWVRRRDKMHDGRLRGRTMEMED